MGARGAFAALSLAIAVGACKPSLDLGTNQTRITLSQNGVALPEGFVTVAQDGVATSFDVSLFGDAAGSEAAVDFPIVPLPANVSMTKTRSGPTTETITLTATRAAAAGDHPVTITAKNDFTGATSEPVPFTLVVAIAVRVDTAPDTTLGVGGQLQEVASTAFQPASFQTFIPNTSALAAMHPPHPLVQIFQPVQSSDGTWDFTTLNEFVQTLETVSTEGPELQIFSPPLWPPEALDATGKFDFSKPANVQHFADYCANLVRYYNQGGFTYEGQPIVNPAGADLHVTWWGILGDFNYQDTSTSIYPGIYNEAVAEMLAVDPNIKISALEFSDSQATPPQMFLPGFLEPADSGGVDQQVDAVSVHMYATSRQGVSDWGLFQSVAPYGQDVAAIREMLQARRHDLGNPPVWITQSNVDSNTPNDAGLSNTTGEPFVKDLRGTSPFFAAWAPYMFSQLGQHGAAAFTHWNYTAGHDPGNPASSLDQQNAEINYDTGQKYLSYWVDLALAQTYPPGANPSILGTSSTDDPSKPSVDVLVTQSGSKIVVMFEDIAAQDALDANATGAFPRTVIVDLQLFMPTPFSATRLTIDGLTDPNGGPTTMTEPFPADWRVPLRLDGYGVAFLTLTPTP
jgi:hypothetical protein